MSPKKSSLSFWHPSLREYKHPLDHQAKNHFFILKSSCFSPKIVKKKKKLSKSVLGYYKKKKWHGPLSHWCREVKILVFRPLIKTLFLCVSSLTIFVVLNALARARQLSATKISSKYIFMSWILNSLLLFFHFVYSK